MLSSYPSDILAKYVKEFGWVTRTFDMRISVNAKNNVANKRKVEVLTMNYQPPTN